MQRLLPCCLPAAIQMPPASFFGGVCIPPTTHPKHRKKHAGNNRENNTQCGLLHHRIYMSADAFPLDNAVNFHLSIDIGRSSPRCGTDFFWRFKRCQIVSNGYVLHGGCLCQPPLLYLLCADCINDGHISYPFDRRMYRYNNREKYNENNYHQLSPRE